ncbi:MAG TPA: hypothetical protein PKG64_21120, partial [Cyclobacteriaceae bacterium]|nr:hypothetical protein [Cyclobacteriaceae bacterium]
GCWALLKLALFPRVPTKVSILAQLGCWALPIASGVDKQVIYVSILAQLGCWALQYSYNLMIQQKKSL